MITHTKVGCKKIKVRRGCNDVEGIKITTSTEDIEEEDVRMRMRKKRREREGWKSIWRGEGVR